MVSNSEPPYSENNRIKQLREQLYASVTLLRRVSEVSDAISLTSIEQCEQAALGLVAYLGKPDMDLALCETWVTSFVQTINKMLDE